MNSEFITAENLVAALRRHAEEDAIRFARQQGRAQVVRYPVKKVSNIVIPR